MKKANGNSLDFSSEETRRSVLRHCRLNRGEVWRDPEGRHLVGCGDATDGSELQGLFGDLPGATLVVQDPPYNLVMFERRSVEEYTTWCRRWLDSTHGVMAEDSSLYIWLGADQRDHFQPLPQFMAMMAETDFTARSFITMRNQRGYGTPKNWMAVRQELLYYTKGSPYFEVQYTEIPRITKGYYKKVGGEITENHERSHSDCIRASNVWVDIQQVFYRMQENVNGCLAQKPLAAIERIIQASSRRGDVVLDSFAHSGTTLLACERTDRRCVTMDIDPIFAEITIRRLERLRRTGKTGWQNSHPFAEELSDSVSKCELERRSAL